MKTLYRWFKITYAKYDKVTGKLQEGDYEFILDYSAKTRKEVKMKAIEYKKKMTRESKYEYEIIEIKER